MTIFPALATGYRCSAVATRMTRSALLEVLREDYVRTSRAKGLVRKLIIRRHALKNAVVEGDDLFFIEVPALLRKHLVFDVNRSDASPLVFAHGAHHIESVAISGVGISNHRQAGGSGNSSSIRHHVFAAP